MHKFKCQKIIFISWFERTCSLISSLQSCFLEEKKSSMIELCCTGNTSCTNIVNTLFPIFHNLAESICCKHCYGNNTEIALCWKELMVWIYDLPRTPTDLVYNVFLGWQWKPGENYGINLLWHTLVYDTHTSPVSILHLFISEATLTPCGQKDWVSKIRL